MERTLGILKFRQQYKTAGKLDGAREAVIWSMEINRLKADIDFAATKVVHLRDALSALQKNCLKTQGELSGTLSTIRSKITGSMNSSKAEIAKLEGQLKTIHCTFWNAIFFRCHMSNTLKS